MQRNSQGPRTAKILLKKPEMGGCALSDNETHHKVVAIKTAWHSIQSTGKDPGIHGNTRGTACRGEKVEQSIDGARTTNKYRGKNQSTALYHTQTQIPDS